MRDECEHGHLRRSCDMCNVIADHVREITEKNAEIAELRYSLAQAQGVAQACEARAERAEASNAALREAAEGALHALESSRVFVTSRERIHKPDGESWYDERVAKLRAALKGDL